MSNTNVISLDFRDHKYLEAFIAEHKDEKFPLVGTNDRGQMVVISAVADNVDVATYQDNRHTIHHTYWLDYEVEEWFE